MNAGSVAARWSLKPRERVVAALVASWPLPATGDHRRWSRVSWLVAAVVAEPLPVAGQPLPIQGLRCAS